MYGNELSKIFGDIVGDDDLLEECYCPVRTRGFDEFFAPSFITGIPNVVFASGQIEPGSFIRQWLSENSSQKYSSPCVIVGDVGTGKSTFINHFFRVFLKQNNLTDLIKGIIIDLSSIPPHVKTIRNEITMQFEKGLLQFFPEIRDYTIEDFKEVYNEHLGFDIAILKEMGKDNPQVAKVTLLKKIDQLNQDSRIKGPAHLSHIRRTRPGILTVLVLDNVDHHPGNVQEEIFYFARSMVREYRCPIIMTARQYTVPKAYRHLALSAFQPRFLALSLPDTKELILKRKNYLLEHSAIIDKVYKLTKKDEIQITQRGKTWSMKLVDLKARMQVLLDSFLTSDVIRMLENLANYDFRYLLKTMNVALSSGYLYPEDGARRRKDISEYDLLRAIILGNNPYFSPHDSTVVNLFCNGGKNIPNNNLVRYRLLQAMNYFGNEVGIHTLMDFMKSIGYEEEQVSGVLDLFLSLGLVESPLFEGKTLSDNISRVSLTYSGRYYVDYLAKSPRYLQYMMNGSFIDEDYYELIRESLEAKTGADRKEKERIVAIYQATDFFIEYLKHKEGEERTRIDRSENKFGVLNISRLPPISELEQAYTQAKNKIVGSL